MPSKLADALAQSSEESYLQRMSLTDALKFGIELQNKKRASPEQASANRAQTAMDMAYSSPLAIPLGLRDIATANEARDRALASGATLDEANRIRNSQAFGGLLGIAIPGRLPFGPTAQVTGKTAKDLAYAIPAWHGSPHDFEKFDLGKIGTGEGAQMYGRGFYFAEHPETARTYQRGLSPIVYSGNEIDKLSPMGQHLQSKVLGELQDKIANQEKAIAELEQTRLRPDIANYPNMAKSVEDMLKNHRANLAMMKEAEAMDVQTSGKLYNVNLDVEPHQLIDWDKSFNDQSPYVIDALTKTPHGKALIDQQKLVSDLSSKLEQFRNERMTSETAKQASAISQRLLQERNKLDVMDAQFHNYRDWTNTPEAVASLHKAGIPGIRYLDQGSRGSGEGTSNYVIFDPELIKILGKQ